MKRTWAALRISIGLVGLTSVIVLIAAMLGLVPDEQRAVLEGRKSLCEAIAVHCSLAATRGDVDSIRASMAAVVERNADVLGASVRQADGRVMAESRKGPTGAAPGKGDSPHLPERPGGCFAQKGTVPFSARHADVAAWANARRAGR